MHLDDVVCSSRGDEVTAMLDHKRESCHPDAGAVRDFLIGTATSTRIAMPATLEDSGKSSSATMPVTTRMQGAAAAQSSVSPIANVQVHCRIVRADR
jgi:hypothetical protein